MTTARKQTLNRLKNAQKNGSFAAYFMLEPKEAMEGGYMKSTGGRLRGWTSKAGNVWDWKRSEMEKHMLLLIGGCRTGNIYSTWRWYAGNEMTVWPRPGGCAFQGSGKENYSDLLKVCYLRRTETTGNFRGKDRPLSRKLQA